MSQNSASPMIIGGGATAASGRIIPAALALLLGGFILVVAGFAPAAALHNAAHDARHSFAFPCH